MDPLSLLSIDLGEVLHVAVLYNKFERVEEVVQAGADVNFRTSLGHPLLHLAIDLGALLIARRLLELGADPNAVSTMHLRKGYTPLHFACLNGNQKLVKLLINTYHVDPSAVADDGLQPIHLAIFYDNYSIVELLVKASVDVETNISKELFEKYYEEMDWRDNYGDSITLLTFAVLHNKFNSARVLIECGANLRIENFNGCTLLMSAIYYYHYNIVSDLVGKLKRKDINHRDNDGFTCLHYIFKREGSEYDQLVNTEDEEFDNIRFGLLELLVRKGANINLLIDGDPATLLINIAAYLHDYRMLDFLLPRQKYWTIAKPLFYATMPDSFGYPSNYLSIVRKNNFNDDRSSIKSIVQNIILRNACGCRVLKCCREEVELIENQNLNIDVTTSAFEQSINRMVKDKKITFGDNELLVSEIFTKNDKALKLLGENNLFLHALNDYGETANLMMPNIMSMIKVRMDEAFHKIRMIKEECQKLLFSSESMFYYIPFDWTLKLVEYLDIDDLGSFIDAYN